MERQDIIAKIRKLLKLQYGAEKIGSTGEAYQAARMVQKLLLEYNLQMSDIGEAEEGDTTRITESDGIPYADQYGNTWKLQLMNVICKFNLCRCLYNGPTRRMTIVGAEANVIICREFYQYLLKVFTRLSMDRLNEAQNEAMRNRRFLTEDKKKEYVRSYLEGVGQGLYENYESRQATVQETGLVLSHNTLIDTFLKEQKCRIRKGHRRIYGANDEAFGVGFEDGRNVSLNQQVGSSAGPARHRIDK